MTDAKPDKLMTSQSSTACDLQIIEDFLEGSLDDSASTAFERHLNECDECCGDLQRRAAEAGLWKDARAYLSSVDNLFDGKDGDSTRERVKGDTLRLDFLAPTDDPRMLGRFAGCEISGAIGSGGMGIVLKGFDVALNRYSAIKVLAPHYASSAAARKRFAREAQAAAAVVHNNVIAIHGVDEFNGLPYLVMPYVKGESLQKRIDRESPMGTAEVLRIAMQIAKGLSAAHDQGLVHRDIKPANILLPENVERVMITDFGLARAADDASLTRSGVIAGTPQYMSPEQARGDAVDGRSDLFSMGSVMYAMCTGRAPFRAETPYGILRRITDHEARPILEVNSKTPDWLASIIDRLLAKRAADRFATSEQVATLLEDCLAHVQHPTVVPLPAALPRSRRTTYWMVWPGLLMILALTVGFVKNQFLQPTPPPEDDTRQVSEIRSGTRQEFRPPQESTAESPDDLRYRELPGQTVGNSIEEVPTTQTAAAAVVAKQQPVSVPAEVTETDLLWEVNWGIESLTQDLAKLNADIQLSGE